jgi:hypothetical protein
VNMQRLPQTCSTYVSKCYYSKRSHQYDKDYHSQDNMSRNNQELVYKFDYGRNYAIAAYGVLYGTVFLGVPALIPSISSFVQHKFLFGLSEIYGIVALVLLHSVMSYYLLTRIPIRMYHDREAKTFTFIVYEVKKLLQKKHIIVPEGDIRIKANPIPGFQGVDLYVPTSVNKSFFFIKDGFSSGGIFTKFLAKK